MLTNRNSRASGFISHNGNGHNGERLHVVNGNGRSHGLPAEVEDKLHSDDFLRAFELDLPPVDLAKIEAATVDIVEAVGEDPQREGLLDTPRRVARAYQELLSGYRIDPARLINGAIFDVEYDDMVIVRDIEYSSMCEHHMLPFMGHAHVAYIPDRKIIGLSKIPRIVDMFARRLQVQERLTRQVADFLNEVLQPKGVAVVVDGVHMCSKIRGVEKHDSSMTTSVMLGVFRDNGDLRRDLIAQLSRPNRDLSY